MDNLFGNVTLGEELLDIPDKPVEAADTATTDETGKDTEKPKNTDTNDDDEFIDVQVGNTVKPVTDEDEDLNPDGFKEDTDDEPLPKTQGSSSSSIFKPFVKTLAEEGVLPSITDEEFDKLVEELGSPTEALVEFTRRSILADIEEYKNSAEGDYKSFLEARDAGLDLNQWADIQEAKSYYSSITSEKIDDDEQLQKDLITEQLRFRGIPDDEIEETIEAFETTGKLADNAKKAHKNLIKFAEQQEIKLKEDKVKRDAEQQKQREESIKTLRKEVDAVVEIIPGMKINKQTKDKIFKNITTVVKTGANGEQYNAAMAKRAEDPIKYALIENYLLELGVFDGKWDKVVARAKTKATTELEKALREEGNTAFSAGKNTLGSGSSDDDVDFSFGGLVKNKKHF